MDGLKLILFNRDYIDMGRGGSHIFDPGGSVSADR